MGPDGSIINPIPGQPTSVVPPANNVPFQYNPYNGYQQNMPAGPMYYQPNASSGPVYYAYFPAQNGMYPTLSIINNKWYVYNL